MRAGSGAVTMPRGRSFWLFAGWVAFLLTTVMIPCCETVAAGGSGGPLDRTGDAHVTTDDSGLHAHPQSDFDCTELTAAAGPVPVATVPGERGIEPAPAIPATASEFPQGANSVRSRLSPVLPPGVRVYLGTLRLRI